MIKNIKNQKSKSKSTNKISKMDGIITIDDGFGYADGANVTPRIKKDGSMLLSSMWNAFSGFKEFVVVGGDFI